MLPAQDQPTAAGEVTTPAQKPADQKVDLQALADRVYRLLKQELLVERERRGWKRRR
jgi:hypothetical protein